MKTDELTLLTPDELKEHCLKTKIRNDDIKQEAVRRATPSANPPMVEGFPEEAFKNWWLKNRGENLGPVDIARWGFAQGTLAAHQPARDERNGDQARAWSFAMDVFKSAKMSPDNPLFSHIQKRMMRHLHAQAPTEPVRVEPSPLTDEELEQLREIEAKDAADERKGPDDTTQAQLERARAAAPTEPTREQVAALVEAATELLDEESQANERNVVRTDDGQTLFPISGNSGRARAFRKLDRALAPFAEKGGS